MNELLEESNTYFNIIVVNFIYQKSILFPLKLASSAKDMAVRDLAQTKTNSISAKSRKSWR